MRKLQIMELMDPDYGFEPGYLRVIHAAETEPGSQSGVHDQHTI
jgi:hypothetical protein